MINGAIASENCLNCCCPISVRATIKFSNFSDSYSSMIKEGDSPIWPTYTLFLEFLKCDERVFSSLHCLMIASASFCLPKTISRLHWHIHERKIFRKVSVSYQSKNGVHSGLDNILSHEKVLHFPGLLFQVSSYKMLVL